MPGCGLHISFSRVRDTCRHGGLYTRPIFYVGMISGGSRIFVILETNGGIFFGERGLLFGGYITDSPSRGMKAIFNEYYLQMSLRKFM